jgi:hypothetical protein
MSVVSIRDPFDLGGIVFVLALAFAFECYW